MTLTDSECSESSLIQSARTYVLAHRHRMREIAQHLEEHVLQWAKDEYENQVAAARIARRECAKRLQDWRSSNPVQSEDRRFARQFIEIDGTRCTYRPNWLKDKSPRVPPRHFTTMELFQRLQKALLEGNRVHLGVSEEELSIGRVLVFWLLTDPNRAAICDDGLCITMYQRLKFEHEVQSVELRSANKGRDYRTIWGWSEWVKRIEQDLLCLKKNESQPVLTEHGGAYENILQPPALRRNDQLVINALASVNSSHLASVEEIHEAMDASKRLGVKTIGTVLRRLIKLDMVERPQGERNGARLTLKGRRLASGRTS